MLTMRKNFSIKLDENENVAIITEDGKMKQGIARNQYEILRNADAIQEFMIKALKKPETREGIWIWKIIKDWSAIIGVKYEDL
jgi:hypothetical protein